MKDYIRTFTGRMVRPAQMTADDVCIEDIAHALSNLCRFTGHVREFYGVAEHSIRVSILVNRVNGDPYQVLWGLLHDAAEAYIADLSRPVKMQAGLAGYRELESTVMGAVCAHFGLDPFEPLVVKWADGVLCAVEQRDLMGGFDPDDEYTASFKLAVEEYYPWSPNKFFTSPPWFAERLFLDRCRNWLALARLPK